MSRSAVSQAVLIRSTLLALVLAGVMVAVWSSPADAATTFTVNKSGDASDMKLNDARCDSSSKKGKQCTLRAAIEEANDTSGEDTIKFDIGGSASVKTISPESELPEITDAITINGYSQRGAQENTLEQGTNAVLKVEISGADATPTNGLSLIASDSTIKGLVINGFGLDGLEIFSSESTGNSIEGNFIGTTADGTEALGNNTGVHIQSAPGNTIGGTEPAQRNIISSGTGGDGILVSGSEATGNSILSNSIYSNAGLGIDLLGGTEDANDVTANDSDDPDTGPNNLQNFPTISSTTRSSSTGFTTISGSLNSNPNQDFLIQCFLTESPADGSEHGEGEVLLDTTSRSTGPLGNTPFQCDSRVPGVGETVTATATNVSTGDTSEFSENEVVVGLVSPP